MKNEKFNIQKAQELKKNGEKFTMLSVYDYPTAKYAEAAGIDALLVGDSLAMTILGHADTVSVTMEEMLHHVKAVSRAADRCMVVADMPFMSYQTCITDAVRNAGRFLKEGRADAVKIEGGAALSPTLQAIQEAGIPIIGHIGLTPQSAGQLGGLKVQGNSLKGAEKLLEDALAFQNAGAFAILMECIPAKVAEFIHSNLEVPTISYGAGQSCDAQGLVLADVIGLFDKFLPKFSKRYADIGALIEKAISEYKHEVVSGAFPSKDYEYGVSADFAALLDKELDSSKEKK